MSAQIGAIAAAVGSVVRGIFGRRVGTFAGVAFAAVALGGCTVPTASLVGADPADPAAKVAGVAIIDRCAYSSLRRRRFGWWEQNQTSRRYRNPDTSIRSRHEVIRGVPRTEPLQHHRRRWCSPFPFLFRVRDVLARSRNGRRVRYRQPYHQEGRGRDPLRG